MNMLIAAGLGEAEVTRDGDIVYSEVPNSPMDPPTLQRFEDLALADPDHDWRVLLNLPLREAEYQRHGPGQWVLVKSGEGFA
jgi:hypothetical protein